MKCQTTCQSLCLCKRQFEWEPCKRFPLYMAWKWLTTCIFLAVGLLNATLALKSPHWSDLVGHSKPPPHQWHPLGNFTYFTPHKPLQNPRKILQTTWRDMSLFYCLGVPAHINKRITQNLTDSGRHSISAWFFFLFFFFYDAKQHF